MARKPRCRSSLQLYHIVIRGINKQDIFIDNQDKSKFIKELLLSKEKFEFKLYAYIIMPNHVHLVIKEKDIEISKIMHRIQLSYSAYLNIKYDRVGHVFQGRFYSKNIENEEYLKCVIRYIHLNPDKAGIGKYNQYKWSSFSDYIKSENSEKNGLVDVTDILNLYNEERGKAITLFEEFHKEKSKYKYNEEYSEFEIKNRLDDEEVIKIITENLGIQSIYDVHKLNNKYRNQVLHEILNIKGTTIMQISRITGISKKIIERAKYL